MIQKTSVHKLLNNDITVNLTKMNLSNVSLCYVTREFLAFPLKAGKYLAQLHNQGSTSVQINLFFSFSLLYSLILSLKFSAFLCLIKC